MRRKKGLLKYFPDKDSFGMILALISVGCGLLCVIAYLNAIFDLQIELDGNDMPESFDDGLAFLLLTLIFMTGGYLLLSEKVADFFRPRKLLVLPVLFLFAAGLYGAFQIPIKHQNELLIFRTLDYPTAENLKLLKKLYQAEAPDWEKRQELFFLAVRKNNRPALKFFLDEGVDVNIRDDYGNTPLLYGCQWGEQATLKLLLERGADVSAKNRDEETAIMVLLRAKGRSLAEIRSIIQMLKQKEGEVKVIAD